jgi:hypothetical protein
MKAKAASQRPPDHGLARQFHARRVDHGAEGWCSDRRRRRRRTARPRPAPGRRKSITSAISTMCIRLGRMWRPMMAKRPTPKACAACTYSSSRSFSVSPRSRRAHAGPAGHAEDQAQRQQARVGALGGGGEPVRMGVDDHLHHQHRGRDQQHAGDRTQRGVEVLDQVIHPAADIAGEDAQQHRQRQHHQRGQGADQEARCVCSSATGRARPGRPCRCRRHGSRRPARSSRRRAAGSAAGSAHGVEAMPPRAGARPAAAQASAPQQP